jgi:hypothetical protein
MQPGDLALGIRDLFAVLVPGALFLLLILPYYPVSPDSYPPEIAQALPISILLLIAAYAVGSLIGAAAGVLDPLAERIYRPARSLWPSRRALAKDVAAQFDSLRSTARGLERRILKDTGVPTNDTPMWNDKAFWRNYLRISSAAAVGELDRVEAQQKLFRALSLVFLLAALLRGPEPSSVAMVVVALLFFALFVTYRRRFNVRLYQSAIAYYCYARQEGGVAASPAPPQQAAAAVIPVPGRSASPPERKPKRVSGRVKARA